MKDEKLKIGIEDIRKMLMTGDEKKRVFENVLKFSAENKESVLSPFASFSFSSFIFHRNKLVYYAAVLMIFVLGGGGVIFASEKSLPDSVLYPLKVKVLEPIEGALAFSPKAKAKHESGLAVRRLVEAETLSEQGRLDTSKEKQIKALLEEHTTALGDALEGVDQAGQADEISDNFYKEMDSHAQILDTITQNEDNSKPEDKNNKISETARTSADKIKNIVIDDNARRTSFDETQHSSEESDKKNKEE